MRFNDIGQVSFYVKKEQVVPLLSWHILRPVTTYLLHEAQTVPLVPRFDKLAIFNAKYHDDTERDHFVGRCDAQKLTRMRALDCPSQYDLVAFRDDILNCGMKIREASKKDLP